MHYIIVYLVIMIIFTNILSIINLRYIIVHQYSYPNITYSNTLLCIRDNTLLCTLVQMFTTSRCYYA